MSRIGPLAATQLPRCPGRKMTWGDGYKKNKETVAEHLQRCILFNFRKNPQSLRSGFNVETLEPSHMEVGTRVGFMSLWKWPMCHDPDLLCKHTFCWENLNGFVQKDAIMVYQHFAVPVANKFREISPNTSEKHRKPVSCLLHDQQKPWKILVDGSSRFEDSGFCEAHSMSKRCKWICQVNHPLIWQVLSGVLFVSDPILCCPLIPIFQFTKIFRTCLFPTSKSPRLTRHDCDMICEMTSD